MQITNIIDQMHYRGYVYCRCFQEGKTTTPPFPNELRYNEEGFYFNSQNSSIPLFKKQVQLEAWKKTACQHPNMESASALIANDMGLDNFNHYLYKNGGKEVYPKTLQLLSRVGKEPVFPIEASKFLKELKILKKRAQLTSTTKLTLRETETHRLIMIGDYEDETFFALLENGHIFLLKNESFYILKQEKEGTASVLFKANSFYTQSSTSNLINFFKEGENLKISTIRGLGAPQKNQTKIQYKVQVETFNNYNYWKTLIEGLERLLKNALESHHAILWDTQ